MGFLDFFRRRKADPRGDLLTQDQARIAQYARFLRAYQGFAIRGLTGTSLPTDYKRIRFNFTQPIVNLSAGWFAAKPLDWQIDNEDDATQAAYDIWDRSGGDRALLDAALCAGIYGEIVALATQDDDTDPKIEFVDPSICFPTFDGADYSTLTGLEIVYQVISRNAQPLTHREIYHLQADGTATRDVYEDETQIGATQTFENGMPAVWIRNHAVKGMPFGLSDVEPIFDLVEEYDHLASKQTRIVDYYAAPNLMIKGVQKGEVERSERTVYYLPSENADMKFLEWSGSAPDVEAQLTRIRNAIAEISQVPAVAFGQADSGLTSISGVAIQILYGPLLSKTHRKQAMWGPALETVMWQALQADGFDVAREAVNCLFTSGTPVDGQAMVAEASAKVAAKLSSRRREMQDLGIENPDSELKRIVIEEKILQLAQPAPAIEQDANVAARSGARGMFSPETPEGIGANKPGSMQEPMAGGTGMPQANLGAQIAAMLEQMDALLDAENENIETAERVADSDEEKAA